MALNNAQISQINSWRKLQGSIIPKQMNSINPETMVLNIDRTPLIEQKFPNVKLGKLSNNITTDGVDKEYNPKPYVLPSELFENRKRQNELMNAYYSYC